MGTNRKYNCTDSEMLTASETILNHCTDNSEKLIEEKPIWQDPYFPGLITTVQEAYSKYLGIDNAKVLRNATLALKAIIKPAQEDLSKFKTNISVDYSKDKVTLDETLNTLGFHKYPKAITNHNQEQLIGLLSQFSQNLTAELEADLVSKGTNPVLLTRIKEYASTLTAANVAQETAKGTRPEVTAASINALNNIYDDVIGICKVAQNIFKDDKIKHDLFSFSKTLSVLNGPHNGTDGEEDTPPPPES